MFTSSRRFRQVVGAIQRPLCLMLLIGFLAGPACSAAAAEGPACRDGSTRLCLVGRFQVEATWRDGGGRDRVALALPLASSGTGAFSFFGGEDADLLVRVAEPPPQGGRSVIETGAAAGVGFELRVLDTVSGVEWTHTNPRAEASQAGRLVAKVLEAGGGDRLSRVGDRSLLPGWSLPGDGQATISASPRSLAAKRPVSPPPAVAPASSWRSPLLYFVALVGRRKAA